MTLASFHPFLTGIVFLLVSPSAWATTYHVDGDSGDNANDGLSESSAWRDPWVAAERIAPGDTVIIHEKSGGSGMYNNGCAKVISADTSDTTWLAAPGETVRISQTNDFSSAPYTVCPNVATIGIGAPNITIDGFVVWGSIEISSTGDHATVQNCDLAGGGDSQGFPAVIRIYGKPSTPGYGSCSGSGDNCVNDTDCPASQTCTGDTSEWTDNVTVRHCHIHDNKPALGQGSTNDTAIMTYGASHMVVEYCEFHSTLNQGIKWKDRSWKNTARYNYFHDMPTGIQGDGQFGQHWIRTHNNVFSNITEYAIATENAAVHEFGVYNNTFFNAGTSMGTIGWWHSGFTTPIDSYNNIFFFDDGGDFYHWGSTYWDISKFNIVDYNRFYSVAGNSDFFVNNQKRGDTLLQWQQWLDSEGATGSNGDDNSIWGDPGFVNASGTYSEVNDFKRTSYPTDGREGAVMGAFASDAASVGPGGANQAPGPPDGGEDAGGDIGPDAGSTNGPDSGGDVGQEVSADTGGSDGDDAGPDVAPEVVSDAGPDATADTQVDAPPDPDAAVDVQTDTAPTQDATVDTSADAPPDPDAGADVQTDTAPTQDATVDTSADATPGPDAAADVQADTTSNSDITGSGDALSGGDVGTTATPQSDSEGCSASGPRLALGDGAGPLAALLSLVMIYGYWRRRSTSLQPRCRASTGNA